MISKLNSLFIVFVSYFLPICCSILFIYFYEGSNLVLKLLYADIIATVIIYLSSYLFSNSSIYDPYWSVIPPFLLLYWLYVIDDVNWINTAILSFSVLFWAIRLTYNWLRGWRGMEHEDWRYSDLRNKSGKYYQLVNFSGIHLFPTIIVFVCCLPFQYVIQNAYLNINLIFGFLICAIGVLYEFISDQQLYKFKKKNKNGIIKSGLWKYSRHPNYYGEILFWWGVFVYGSSLDNFYILILWPISMTIMFLYVSIPWIENKILLTRPEYSDYQKRVSILLPEPSIIKTFFRNR